MQAKPVVLRLAEPGRLDLNPRPPDPPPHLNRRHTQHCRGGGRVSANACYPRDGEARSPTRVSGSV